MYGEFSYVSFRSILLNEAQRYKWNAFIRRFSNQEPLNALYNNVHRCMHTFTHHASQWPAYRKQLG